MELNKVLEQYEDELKALEEKYQQQDAENQAQIAVVLKQIEEEDFAAAKGQNDSTAQMTNSNRNSAMPGQLPTDLQNSSLQAVSEDP